MKHLLLLLPCFASLLAFSNCKKDASTIYPEPARDFTGEYYFRGTFKSLSAPQTQPVLLNYVVGPNANSVDAESFSSWGESLLLSSYLRASGTRFEVSISGRVAPLNLRWPLADLDSIFRVGQKLSFGQSYGQVFVTFLDPAVLFNGSGSMFFSSRLSNIDNSGNFLEITALEDLRPYLDKPYWAQKMTFKVKCRMRHLGGSPEDVFELEGEGAVLLKP